MAAARALGTRSDLYGCLRPIFPRIRRQAGTADEENDNETRPERVCLARSALVPKLFDYQAELVPEVVEVFRKRGVGLVALPTGAGKTRTAVAAALECAAQGLLRATLWLAPTVELLDQAQATFSELWLRFGRAPDITLCRSAAAAGSSGGAVVLLATPQLLHSQNKRGRSLGAWDGVFFDEAHQLGARTYRRAVESLRASDGLKPGLVGLSATPGRVDPLETEDLVTWFDGRLLKSERLRPNPVRVLQRRGVLARLRFEPLVGAGIVNKTVAIIKKAQALADAGSRVLVFTESVHQAEAVADALSSEGVRARAVSSRTPDRQRRRSIDAFGSGKASVLVNQRLLATGYDCPAVDNLVLGAKIGSPILFEQIVGRAARGPTTGGSATATIWQFDDHLRMHGLPVSYYRYADFDWN